MSETSIGQFVFLEGHCGRIEVEDGTTLFIRIDEYSHPGRVGEAHEHFRARHDTGEPFPGTGLWADDKLVRITALRWDAARGVLRLKIERADT